MTELCPCSGSKVGSGLFWALSWQFWPHFLKISTSNMFCPVFTLKLIGKPNYKSIGLKMTMLAPEKPYKWSYLNSCNFGYYQYFAMIIFAAVRRLNS